MASAEQVRDALDAADATVATAESLTGGQLAAAFTNVPGISSLYVGGAVTYWTSFKQSLLGVSPAIVAEHGVVSAECAEAMASGIRDLAGSTYALSTTGVAGPDEQEGKAVGTVFVGCAGPGGARSVRLALSGSRTEIQAATCQAAFEMLLAELDAPAGRE